MQSDIKLDETSAVVEGTALVSKTWDIMLDAPDRRQRAEGVRRALVHDFNDGLTLNFAEDYPGGVTISGKTHLSIKTVLQTKLRPAPASPGGFDIPGGFGGLPGGILKVDVFAAISESQAKQETNLAAEIRRLREAVLELNERLKRLEGS